MGRLDETRFIERQQFFNGQRLFDRDLQGLEAFNREMRWRHNQSLHQPGIGNGFAVSGKKGDREVAIGPGYAIDAKGREIVLTEAQKKPVPPVAGEPDGRSVFYDLTVSYPADEDLEEVETRAGVCQPRGVVRRREEPVFCWVRLKETETGSLVVDYGSLAEDVKSGQKIVLARVEVLNCQLNSVPSVAQRRNARPAKQAYVSCGEVKPDPWELVWFVDRETIKEFIIEQLTRTGVIRPGEIFARVFASVTSSALAEEPSLAAVGLAATGIAQSALLGPFILPFGIKANIDTCQANFLTPPCYTARIDGSRINEIDLTELQESPPLSEEPPPQ
jgi:hypothetical protein